MVGGLTASGRFVASQALTWVLAYSGPDAGVDTGLGKSACRSRQLATALRFTPASWAISVNEMRLVLELMTSTLAGSGAGRRCVNIRRLVHSKTE
ncbi:MAG TPA: hypothetical protein DEV93_00535 [Chloroflexi bacterium]|nr:hypothetical protein [Chloroflexota bacterium]